MKDKILDFVCLWLPWLLLGALLIFGVVLFSNKIKGTRTEHKDGYSEITLDGCEYIEVSYSLGWNSGYYSLTHKGNCPNPIHQCQK
jgi:hypothetical protein